MVELQLVEGHNIKCFLYKYIEDPEHYTTNTRLKNICCLTLFYKTYHQNFVAKIQQEGHNILLLHNVKMSLVGQ